MQILLPTLEAKAAAIVIAFRFIVFALMVVGLIAYYASERTHGSAMAAPVLKAVVILGALASLDMWYPKIDETFLAVADYINPGYSNNPTLVSDTVRESTTENPDGKSWSWLRINESIYHAFTSAVGAFFIFIGTLLTVPMLITQYILKWLLYMLMPLALATFILPGFSSIGVRFLQQVIAIHAWPVGFALTNLVSLSLWNDFRNAVGANPQNLTDGIYSPFLTQIGGILTAIVLIVGMIATPIVAQRFFVDGSPFNGTAGSPLSVFRMTASLVRGSGLTSARAPKVTAQKASARVAEIPPPLSRPGI